MKRISFQPKKRRNVDKTTIIAQSTSDFSPKHHTSEISIKTSDQMLKYQKWKHCWQSPHPDNHPTPIKHPSFHCDHFNVVTNTFLCWCFSFVLDLHLFKI